MAADLSQASKYLSFLLRHKPEAIGLTLDAHGWAAVKELVDRTRSKEVAFTAELISRIVNECPKQRFELDAAHGLVRCRQGHSFEVQLELDPVQPPEKLFHGTASRFMPSILSEGLTRQARHHVHLTPDRSIAAAVGARYGSLVILEIASGGMFRDGYRFFQTTNGVWLTDQVPPGYLRVIADDETIETDEE